MSILFHGPPSLSSGSTCAPQKTWDLVSTKSHKFISSSYNVGYFRSIFNIVPVTIRKRSHSTHSTSHNTIQCSATFEDDKYGGWKGVRKSQKTSAWARNGDFINHYALRKDGTTRGESVPVFYIDLKPLQPSHCTVVLLPGIPSTSFSYRQVIELMRKKIPGARILTFDWVGFGLSGMPQPGHGFGYRYFEYFYMFKDLMKQIFANKARNGKIILVAQGYLATQVATEYCHETISDPNHQQEQSLTVKPDSLLLINTPVGVGLQLMKNKLSFNLNNPLPSIFKTAVNPILGPLVVSDPTFFADKAFNSAGPYAMAEVDLEVLRQPFLESGMAQLAARAAIADIVDQVNNKETQQKILNQMNQLVQEYKNGSFQLVQSAKDKWIDPELIRNVVKEIEGTLYIKTLGHTGHFAQEDYPELMIEVIDNILHLLRKQQ